MPSSPIASSASPPPCDVFVSYASDQQHLAHKLQQDLHRQFPQLRVFEDVSSITTTGPSSSYSNQLDRACEQARVGIFLITPQFLVTKWTLRELTIFLDRYVVQQQQHQDEFSPTLTKNKNQKEQLLLLPVWCADADTGRVLSAHECCNLTTEEFQTRLYYWTENPHAIQATVQLLVQAAGSPSLSQGRGVPRNMSTTAPASIQHSSIGTSRRALQPTVDRVCDWMQQYFPGTTRAGSTTRTASSPSPSCALLLPSIRNWFMMSSNNKKNLGPTNSAKCGVNDKGTHKDESAHQERPQKNHDTDSLVLHYVLYRGGKDQEQHNRTVAVLQSLLSLSSHSAQAPHYDLTTQNSNGDTALHIASRLGNAKAVRLLLQYEMDLHDSQQRRENVQAKDQTMTREFRNSCLLRNQNKQTAIQVAQTAELANEMEWMQVLPCAQRVLTGLTHSLNHEELPKSSLTASTTHQAMLHILVEWLILTQNHKKRNQEGE